MAASYADAEGDVVWMQEYLRYRAGIKGLNVDQPRNLAKTVTVE